MHIVLTESLGIPKEELDALVKPFLAEGHTFAAYERTTDTARLIEEAKDADIMILANMPMPGEVLRACPGLKLINIAFTGVDHVDIACAREMGIAVSNAAGYSNEAVAELAIGMTIALARKMRETEERVRQGKDKTGLVGWEIFGKTVGIVGLGKIGTRSAELFHAFGAKVLAASRSHHDNAPDFVTQTTLDEVLTLSDVVVLHTPLTEETRGMIDQEALSKMKPTAILINLARGPVVNEKDLCDALQNGVIAAAGIDVYDKEPPLDPDTPILKAKNVLATPHIAFASEQSMTLRAQIVFDNLRHFLNNDQINKVL